MPFESTKQQRKCYALKAKGQAGSWDCTEWSGETDFAQLPKHKEKQKMGSMKAEAPGIAASLNIDPAQIQQAASDWWSKLPAWQQASLIGGGAGMGSHLLRKSFDDEDSASLGSVAGAGLTGAGAGAGLAALAPETVGNILGKVAGQAARAKKEAEKEAGVAKALMSGAGKLTKSFGVGKQLGQATAKNLMRLPRDVANTAGIAGVSSVVPPFALPAVVAGLKETNSPHVRAVGEEGIPAFGRGFGRVAGAIGGGVAGLLSRGRGGGGRARGLKSMILALGGGYAGQHVGEAAGAGTASTIKHMFEPRAKKAAPISAMMGAAKKLAPSVMGPRIPSAPKPGLGAVGAAGAAGGAAGGATGQKPGGLSSILSSPSMGSSMQQMMPRAGSSLPVLAGGVAGNIAGRFMGVPQRTPAPAQQQQPASAPSYGANPHSAPPAPQSPMRGIQGMMQGVQNSPAMQQMMQQSRGSAIPNQSQMKRSSTVTQQLTKQQAVTKMARFIANLAENVPAGTKAASVERNLKTANTLYKLAEAVRKQQDLFKAVNQIYGTKSAAYRHQVVNGLISGLSKQLKKEATLGGMLGVSKHPSASLSSGTPSPVPGGMKTTSPQSKAMPMA